MFRIFNGLHRIDDVFKREIVGCRACASVYFRGQALSAFFDSCLLQSSCDLFLTQTFAREQYPHLSFDFLFVGPQQGRFVFCCTWRPTFGCFHKVRILLKSQWRYYKTILLFSKGMAPFPANSVTTRLSKD